MSSSTSDDKKLQSEIKDGFIQHAITDFEMRRTNLCWDIKEFGSLNQGVDEDKLQFHKTVTLMKHSCKCDLHLVFEPYLTVYGRNKCKSLLKMKLYSYTGKGKILLISVILRDDCSKSPLFTSTKKSWNMTNSKEKNLDFLLPSIDERYSDIHPKLRYCLNDFVKEKTLKIHILFEEGVEMEQTENDPLDPGNEILLDPKVLAVLYEKKLLVDVTFTLPDQQLLHAHSNVLAVVCPYFLSMFTSSKMKEQRTRNVDLTDDKDVSVEIFRGFLDYIYGVKKLKDMVNITKGLAILADKYNCSKLHKECESILCNSLDRSTVVHYLLFSHQYNFPVLKRKALHFAKTNGIDALKDLEGFDEMCKNSELLSEVISCFSAK